ncbi:hypothetical protein Misp01_41340 [Microtetraspora sp. NBRC 13810]|uniref:hypothetical protein n=1 Tax=Microtetraspora sp. NBRC 13810 TaxID=3030990 RepID=UPI00255262E1|nr:hypothetical protein [Microtetraspora sp. NBRC 13810]GLW09004.1 hypothetical protein Misp01_41340 [Microtetraspora sp. NBRC 13810]
MRPLTVLTSLTLAATSFLAPTPPATGTGTPAPPPPAANRTPQEAATLRAPAGSACDPVGGADCLLPFPNDWFTRPAATPTGLRVNLAAGAMPRNAAGTPIDPARWNLLDGFSPGSMLLANVPGLDLAATGAAPVTDIGRSLRRDAPIVIVDTRTGERWPYWAELDANATDPARTALIIRPARNFREGHRYAVALRGLKDAAGEPVPPPAAFTELATGKPRPDDPLAARRQALKRTLGDLARAGVGAGGLHLAWDFTVASERSLSGAVLRMRDESLKRLRGRSPDFTVTAVTDFTAEQDPHIAREVTGDVLVPNYLNRPGGPPGSRFDLGPDGLPRPSGDQVRARFRCEIPRSAFERPARPALYGHGLLGSTGEVRAANVRAMAGEHGFLFCAAEWIGMAAEDVPNVVSVFGDFGRFPTVTDRLQQSLLGFVFLGRAMITRDGLASHEAFRDGRGRPLVDLRAPLAYDGNSQGGIAGGALVAISPDVRNAVLGVPGMNYSTLLNRSTAFEPFQRLMDQGYPDKLDQQLCFALIQMLWDHAEANGYAQHLTDDPLPGSPRHRVLLHVAFGDHQVSPVTAAVQARTIGARVHRPVTAPGRDPDAVPYWGIESLPDRPYRGSALVVWDSGAVAPPVTNTPPLGPAYGRDPHQDPRHDPDARRQKARFLERGEVLDVCHGPCTAEPVP